MKIMNLDQVFQSSSSGDMTLGEPPRPLTMRLALFTCLISHVESAKETSEQGFQAIEKARLINPEIDNPAKDIELSSEEITVLKKKGFLIFSRWAYAQFYEILEKEVTLNNGKN